MAAARTMRRVAITAVGNAAAPLSTLAISPLLAHGLGVSGRGELAAATAPLLLVILIGPLGLPDAITYFVARRGVFTRSAWMWATLVALVVALVLVGLIAILAEPLAAGSDGLIALIRVASWNVLPATLLALIRAHAAGRGEWGRIATERGIGAAVRFGLIVAAFAASSLTLAVAVVVVALSYWVGVVAYVPVRRGDRDRGNEPHGADVPTVRLGTLMGYGTRVWFGAIAGILLSRIDQVLMVPLSGAEQLGLYVVAVNVSEVILIFNSAVRDVLFASQSAAADVAALGAAARASTLVTTFLGVVIAGCSPWLIPLAFGPAFSGAVPSAIVLLAAIVLGNPGSVAGAGLSARGRPQLRSWSLLIAAVVNLLMLVALVPVLGALGAALATLSGNLVSSNLNIFFVKRSFLVAPGDFFRLRRSDLDRVGEAAVALAARSPFRGR